MKKLICGLLLSLCVSAVWGQEVAGVQVFADEVSVQAAPCPAADGSRPSNRGIAIALDTLRLFACDGVGWKLVVRSGIAEAHIRTPLSEELAAGVFEVLPTDLAEDFDPSSRWSVQSSNYFCYSGIDIDFALVTVTFSSTKTEQNGTQVIDYRIGVKPQGSLPMVDGDEVGDGMFRSLTGLGDNGIGSINRLVPIQSGDCLGVMATTDTSTPTVQLTAGTIVVSY